MHSSDSVVPVSDSLVPQSSSPARVPDWEQEEWNLVDGPGLVPSPQRMSSHVTMACSFHQRFLSGPSAHGGEDSSTRQTSSSTTHSVTGPAPSVPSASMVENPANALSVSVPWIQFCVYRVYFYLPLRVSTLHICFC